MNRLSYKVTFDLTTVMLMLIASFFLLAACASGPAVRSATPAAAMNSPIADASQLPTLSPAPNATSAPAFTDHSLLHRPEPYNGPIAGTGEFGVTFQYDPYLAAGIQAQLIDAYTAESGMSYLLLPQHIAFNFTNGYLDDNPLVHQSGLNMETLPRLVVYPAATYAAMHPLAKAQIEQLQILLETRPSIPGGTLPYLPLQNAAQVFHSQLAYQSFANGAGVRYVTAYSQGVGSITNSQLMYTFQGLTEDEAYYIAAFFPVTTSTLPDAEMVEDWEEFSANYLTYVADTRAMLDNLAPLDFNPDLTLLDALVSSLRVEPEVEFAGVEAAAPPLDFGDRPPVGVYQIYDGEENLYRLYRVELDGRSNQVAAQPNPLLPAPDAAHAVFMDEDQTLWLADLDVGNETRLAEGAELSWPVVWGDAQTLLVGVYLTESEVEGLSSGHIATLDIESGELLVIDKEYLSLGRPAMARDQGSIAYDISAYHGVAVNGRIFRPESGSLPFDPALFDGFDREQPCNLFNPAWSPNGKQLAWLCGGESGIRLVVFDLVRETAMTIFTWQPAQFGALPPTPVWSQDGKMLAIEIWANNREESGLWVFPSDGTLARLYVPTGHDPIWLNPSQLIYADLDENMNGDNKLVDLDYGATGVFAMPPGSMILLAPPF